ncbi:MAG: hypothetical protein LBH43_19035 [Treponema sp.]|nr:hypothetical protein [Treponema sp.]
MKKMALVFALLFVTVVVFGQEFTFQGLPWGSTREQVIEKLGKPTFEAENRIIYSDVFVVGYSARLQVEFDHGLSVAGYKFNVSQPLQTYEAIIIQLIGKYGDPFAMKINTTSKNEYPYFAIWNHAYFHIIIQIEENGRLEMGYYSDLAWQKIIGNMNMEPYKINKLEL